MESQANMTSPSPDQHRLLLYYKGDISALVLFAQQENGSVCFPDSLPPLSANLDEGATDSGKLSVHPAMLLNRINQQLNLDNDILKIESGFSERVDTPGGTVVVHMARFILLDPPHAMMAERACRMRTLPELRRQAPAELELLRRAYVKVMEG